MCVCVCFLNHVYDTCAQGWELKHLLLQKMKPYLNSQAVVLHRKIKPGRGNIKGDPLPSVERDLEGREQQLLPTNSVNTAANMHINQSAAGPQGFRSDQENILAIINTEFYIISANRPRSSATTANFRQLGCKGPSVTGNTGGGAHVQNS